MRTGGSCIQVTPWSHQVTARSQTCHLLPHPYNFYYSEWGKVQKGPRFSILPHIHFFSNDLIVLSIRGWSLFPFSMRGLAWGLALAKIMQWMWLCASSNPQAQRPWGHLLSPCNPSQLPCEQSRANLMHDERASATEVIHPSWGHPRPASTRPTRNLTTAS